MKFNPHVNIVSHHANIKGHEFGHSFFKQFNLVLNALDNLGMENKRNTKRAATRKMS